MKKYLFMAVAAIAALSSCSSDNDFVKNEGENEVKKALTFTATMEGLGGTRAEFDSEAKCAKWNVGDEIIIEGVDEEENDPTTALYVASGTSGDVTTFVPKNPGEEVSGVFFEAFFPASIIGEEGPESPAVINEEWKKDQFNMPMAATSLSTNLKFKNLCGVLAITVKDDQLSQVKSIKVSSANRSVSGILFPYFDVDKDGAMTNLKVALTTSDDPSKTLTVNYKNPVETDASGKVFYVAIPPSLKINDDEENEIFEYLPDPYKELKIEISDGNGTTKSMTTKKDVDIVIERNKIYNITFKDNTPTTGTAYATGPNCEVKWVQLWVGGPKFAEYNIGASSVTETGTKMTFTDAVKTGADYVWGANWCTPSKGDMDELLKAATSSGSSKVICNYCEFTQGDGKWGFKFTGKAEGYTENSVFFPVQDDNSSLGQAVYWSATADGSGTWYMKLFCINGYWYSDWGSSDQDDYKYLVRPVLKN